MIDAKLVTLEDVWSSMARPADTCHAVDPKFVNAYRVQEQRLSKVRPGILAPRRVLQGQGPSQLRDEFSTMRAPTATAGIEPS
eukprot:CAMPEP_0181186776 /NCGR_PEP_ID=MMETSP1096-20121128/10214_1 /TAXON_ID=156174 ORGANISM="Chrysochromulina ericina, Strain CCMP281" /NCGR_SAMPLE_ID=MMETSP1096 /ASSEMBLY_ACC=CAM_ASM_000453 /LENGTH=82 /DNA_ID=CAMNT_0023275695 /DNA_START=408 /DNA_END=657 /DNA_ORIENTATION=+